MFANLNSHSLQQLANKAAQQLLSSKESKANELALPCSSFHCSYIRILPLVHSYCHPGRSQHHRRIPQRRVSHHKLTLVARHALHLNMLLGSH